MYSTVLLSPTSCASRLAHAATYSISHTPACHLISVCGVYMRRFMKLMCDQRPHDITRAHPKFSQWSPDPCEASNERAHDNTHMKMWRPSSRDFFAQLTGSRSDRRSDLAAASHKLNNVMQNLKWHHVMQNLKWHPFHPSILALGSWLPSPRLPLTDVWRPSTTERERTQRAQ
jgi:hypothetical protein